MTHSEHVHDGRTPGTAEVFAGIPVVTSPLVEPGRFYLLPAPHAWEPVGWLDEPIAFGFDSAGDDDVTVWGGRMDRLRSQLTLEARVSFSVLPDADTLTLLFGRRAARRIRLERLRAARARQSAMHTQYRAKTRRRNRRRTR